MTFILQHTHTLGIHGQSKFQILKCAQKKGHIPHWTGLILQDLFKFGAGPKGSSTEEQQKTIL